MVAPGASAAGVAGVHTGGERPAIGSATPTLVSGVRPEFWPANVYWTTALAWTLVLGAAVLVSDNRAGFIVAWAEAPRLKRSGMIPMTARVPSQCTSDQIWPWLTSSGVTWYWNEQVRLSPASKLPEHEIGPRRPLPGGRVKCAPTPPSNQESFVIVELKFRVVPAVTSVDGTTVIDVGKCHPPDPLPTRVDVGPLGAGFGDVVDVLDEPAGGAVVGAVVGAGRDPFDRLTNPSLGAAVGLGVGAVTGVGSGVGDAGWGVAVPPVVVLVMTAKAEAFGATTPIATTVTAPSARCSRSRARERCESGCVITGWHRPEVAPPFGFRHAAETLLACDRSRPRREYASAATVSGGVSR